MDDLKISTKKLIEAFESGKLDDNPLTPIIVAVAANKVDLISVVQSKDRWAVRRPKTVIQIGDDLDDSFGPTYFHSESLIAGLRACSHIALIIAEHPPTVMQMLAQLASGGKTVAFIEARANRELEWVAFIEKHAPRASVIWVQEIPGKPV